MINASPVAAIMRVIVKVAAWPAMGYSSFSTPIIPVMRLVQMATSEALPTISAQPAAIPAMAARFQPPIASNVPPVTIAKSAPTPAEAVRRGTTVTLRPTSAPFVQLAAPNAPPRLHVRSAQQWLG